MLLLPVLYLLTHSKASFIIYHLPFLCKELKFQYTFNVNSTTMDNWYYAILYYPDNQLGERFNVRNSDELDPVMVYLIDNDDLLSSRDSIIEAVSPMGLRQPVALFAVAEVTFIRSTLRAFMAQLNRDQVVMADGIRAQQPWLSLEEVAWMAYRKLVATRGALWFN